MTADKHHGEHGQGAEQHTCCSHKSGAASASPGHMHHGRGCCGGRKGAKQAAKDPVCGMDVDPHSAKHRAEHAGRPYNFCCAGCKTKFLADPQKYLGAK